MAIGRSTSKTHQLSAPAEDAVAAMLRDNGFSCVVQNYSCRFGEIDIIAYKHNILLFVEVKFRRNNTQNYGSALDAITVQKQKKIIKSAACFLAEYEQYQYADCRFDVVVVNFLQQQYHFNWLCGAFASDDLV